MKKLFLITIILLLQSFPSLGNPNGKGIICDLKLGIGWSIDKEGTFSSKIGFVFSDNEVSMEYFFYDDMSETVSLIPYPPMSFSTSKRYIRWISFSKSRSYVLDRKTLKLLEIYNGKTDQYECKVFSSIDYFHKKGELINKYQKFFNKKYNTLDNKI